MISGFVRWFLGGMASSETPPLSIRQGVRIVPPDSNVTVEKVLLAVGEQVGHDKLSFASRMNKAVVVFLKDEPRVYQLVESGVFIRDLFVQVSPLSVPSTRITVSGVPPFIPNELLENELRRFGKFASGFKTVSLGCKDPKLKHGDGFYMVYASSGQFKCFECGDVGDKHFARPHKQQGVAHSADAAGGSTRAGAAAGATPGPVFWAGRPSAGSVAGGSNAGSAAGGSGAGAAAGGSSAGAVGADADPGVEGHWFTF